MPEVGTRGRKELTVTKELLADRVGSGLVSVYATPMSVDAPMSTASSLFSTSLSIVPLNVRNGSPMYMRIFERMPESEARSTFVRTRM